MAIIPPDVPTPVAPLAVVPTGGAEEVEIVEIVEMVEEDEVVVLAISLALLMHFWKRHPHARANAK
jgi:hypothetical protein